MNQYAKAMAAYGQARRAQSPVLRVVEVFDGVLANVARAKAAREDGHRDQEFNAMSLATRLLREMEGCLNRRDPQAREMTRMLSQYYKQVIMQLHGAMRAKGDDGASRYDSVYRQLVSMRNAWAEIGGRPALSAVPCGSSKEDSTMTA